MGKPTGFLEYSRKNNIDVVPAKRIKDFKEFHKPLAEDERMKQAARCMNCGVPLCQSALKLSGMVTGCPLHNLIPEWNDQIYHGHFAQAFSRLQKTSNFPEFTGRVCPALCEKACINGEHSDPVAFMTTSFSSSKLRGKRERSNPEFRRSAAEEKLLSSEQVPQVLPARMI